MKNNNKMTRKTKVEKRRLAFEKRNVKKEQNLARYGAEGGSALVMAKTTEFNRRIIAAVLALVFVLTTIVVGYNFAAKADDPDDGFKMFEAIDDSGFVTRKGIKLDDKGTTDTTDDTYDLRMEAYATAPIATKTLDTKTPLDIVMVMDESSSMGTEDVFTQYDPILNKSTFTINEAEGKYYLDEDGEFYLLSADRNNPGDEANVPVKEGGVEKNSWTAEQANTIKSNLGSLYYKNGVSYEDVHVLKRNWYKNYSGSVRIYNITDGLPVTGIGYGYPTKVKGTSYGNQSSGTGAYVYTGNMWHLVYFSSAPSVRWDYPTTLYYYTNQEQEENDLINNERTWDTYKNQSDVVTLIDSEGYYGWAIANADTGSGKKNYTKGDLYFDQGQSNKYNYMYTSNKVLAVQAPDSKESNYYTGNLYTKGYQLYYVKNGHKVYLENAVFDKDEEAYFVNSEGTNRLYDATIISRTDAQKLAATELAQIIAEASTEEKDHYIAVVGSKESDAVKTNLVEATANDDNPANSVNDIIDTALDSLTSDGGSIANGLVNAQSVFASKTLDPADSRKRIVVIFTDDTEADSNALSEAAKLKDTYNASVYVVGYPDGSRNQSIDNYLSHLSSEYFATATSPIVETENDDGKTYHYYGSDKDGILSAFDTVATKIQSPTTKVALGPENAVFRDVISKYFVFPKTDREELDTTKIDANIVSVSAIADDGNITWGGSEPFALEDAAPNKNLTVTSNSDGSTTIDIIGFDYNRNFVSNSRTDGSLGKKIVVEITGLKLKGNVKADSNRRLYSNAIESGIYKIGAQAEEGTTQKDADMLFAAFPRPFVDEVSNMVPAGSTGLPDADSGIVVNKYLSTNANGNYDLTIEAYTTETSVTTTEKIPTDFIVVADQSGSMAYRDMATGYTDAGATYLETIAEDAAKGESDGYPDGYYYYDETTDNYYRVYPVRSYLYEYIPSETKWTQNIIEDAGMDLSWFQGEREATYSKANQYYYKTSDNVYRPVEVTATGKLGTYYIKFSYKDANGTTVNFVRPSKPVYKNVFGSDTSKYGPGSFGYSAVNAAVLAAYPTTTAYTYSEFLGITTGMYINYPMYKRHIGYTELRYRDVNGVEHTVPASNGNSTWEYCNSSGQAKTTASGSTRPTYTNLYKGTGKITRLQALKNALTSFATAVANEKDDFNQPVDNRIAIVGFSSEKSDTSYTNTELLTGENLTISNNNGVQMRLAGTEDYKTALVSATQSGEFGRVNDKINDAIAALTARGGTQPEDGLEMAYEILRNRDITTYATESSGKTKKVDRNVFVIFFTDGHPGDYEYSDMYSEANDVVEKAKLIKDYRVGDSDVSVDNQVVPSLFSIGVFGESDGNPLTYHAHTYSTAKNYDYLFESGHMDVYNAGWSGYYYLNRNWIASDTSEYGSTANDTIFDYMSVVSSNYPNATKYMQVVNTGSYPGAADKTGYATYYEMVNGVRNSSTASNTNKFYRMASNQATLVAAFEQAVTRATQSISANARLDANAVMRDVFKNTNFVTSGNDTTYNFASVVGSMDRNGVVNFKEESKQILYLPYEVETDENTNNTYIDVTGFDYLANYINNKTATDEGMSDTPHDGKKLVTTITNVVPTGQTGNNLESNISPNSAMYFSGNTLAGKPFPTPAITSYKYTLDVGDVNKNAVFNVTATVWNPNAEEGEEAVDKDSDMLEDVIIVYPNGERHRYREVGAQTFYGMKNGQKFYFENLPGNYQIKTDVTSTDSAYDYKIYYDYDASAPKPLTKGTPETTKFSYANHTINISSTRKPNAVSIREKTVGTYADMTLVFGEEITLEIPIIEGENYANTFTYPCEFNTYHNFSENTVLDDATYQAVFEKVKEENGTITAKLTGFNWAKDGNTGTWTLTTDGFPMRTGDEITIRVKGGDTVKVNEAVTHDYGVTYYSGQDDVSPSDMKLMAADGSLLTGNYGLTLIPVDGTEGSTKPLTFENGILTSENGPVDLAPYQKISSSTDLSEATLSISGTPFHFDYETDGEQEAYVANIRDITDEPPISATVEKNKMDILIVNRMGEIPIESVYDNGHNHIVLYILSGAGVLALAAGGYYVWKKKDEFVEQ